MEEQHNPYSSPEASLQAVQPPPLSSEFELASPGVRLGAAILDGLIALAINLPLSYYGGYWAAAREAAKGGAPVPLSMTLLWLAIGLALFLLVQGYPLHRWAQTWGKRLLDLQIVDMRGNQPSLLHLLTRRYLPVQLTPLVPFVGTALSVVDVLFIFRRNRRCVHDLIAGTQVIVRKPD